MRRLSFKAPIVFRYSIFFSIFFGIIHALIVKRMKVDGFWELDEQMIKDLKLMTVFEEKMKLFANRKEHAMTATMVHFLKTKFPEEAD